MRIVSRGVIIHPDGEVTYYCSADYTPKEKARHERAMKEKDEAKAKKRLEEKRNFKACSAKKGNFAPTKTKMHPPEKYS